MKLKIQKTKTMASGPIISSQIEGEKVEAVTDFIFLGSRITMDGDCSHIKRLLFLGKKAMTNLDSVLESRDITLLSKISIVRAVVFPLMDATVGSERRLKVKVKSLSRVRLFATPWTVAYQGPLSMGFSRQ